METKEFRSLPDFTVIIRVAYNTKENKLSITRYPFSACKNWGHFYRTAVNRYENHYKSQKKVVDEAKNILYDIENSFNDYKED